MIAAAICAIALRLAANASSKPAAPPALQDVPLSVREEAPIDEYFGPFKYSAIGIRMRIGALGRAFHSRAKSDADILHDALILDQSLYAWRNRYPHDRWLAPTAFHLEQLYQAMQTSQARAAATEMLHYIVRYFPNTPYARTSRVRLAQGFPPLHAESPPRPTPNPYASSAPNVPLPASNAPPSTAPAPAATQAGSLPTAAPAPAPSRS